MTWLRNIVLPFNLILLLSFLITGCNNDPEPVTRLQFTTGSSLTTTDRNIAAGEIITTSVFAEAPAGKSLNKFTIEYIYDKGDTVTYLDSTFNANRFAMVFTFGTRGITGEETWIFKTTDTEGKIFERQYTLTTTASAAALPSYSSVYYKKSALQNLSFFSIENGTVYPGYLVQKNDEIKEKITFYFEPGTASDTAINVVGYNSTMLKAISLQNLETIKTNADLQALYTNSGTEVTTLKNITEPKIIAFKTAADKIGLIRITNFEKLFDTTTNKRMLMRVRYEVKTER